MNGYVYEQHVKASNIIGATVVVGYGGIKNSLGAGFTKLVMNLAASALAKLGAFRLLPHVARLYKQLPPRLRFRNPRVLAAALVYEVAKRNGIEVSQSDVARLFSISRYTVRDALRELRKAWNR